MCIGYMQAAFQSYIFMQPQWQSVICRWYGWIYHHFIFVLFLYFSNHSSCHTDQFTVSSLKFGTQDFTDPGLLKIRNPHWFVVVGFSGLHKCGWIYQNESFGPNYCISRNLVKKMFGWEVLARTETNMLVFFVKFFFWPVVVGSNQDRDHHLPA